IPLDRFSFGFPTEDKIALEVDQCLGDDARRWRFWQFNPTDEYVAALCAQRTAGEQLVLVKRIVPLVAEPPFERIRLQLGYKDNEPGRCTVGWSGRGRMGGRIVLVTDERRTKMESG